MQIPLTTTPPEYDVIVVGGGPAGSTVATLLSQWGRRVLVLEKEHFPRHHIGESLLAGTMTLLRKLGVYEKVERAGFVQKHGAIYIWGKSDEPWSILFSEVSDEKRHAFQVERAKFDKILLDHSYEVGATVQQGCRVTEFLRSGERIVGVRYQDQEASQVVHTATCRFCVDASGQHALLGTAKKSRQFNTTLRHFALYTYFRGGKPVSEVVPDLREQDAGNIFVVAMDKGWIWYIPLGEGRYSVGVVTHASLAKELNKERRYQFYLACLHSSSHIRTLLSEAEPETTNLYTQSDWSYICDSFQGPGYLQVGDAACFVDPILSTGVDLAMEGAFRAALAINTLLSQPELTDMALQWYEEEYKMKAGHFMQMAEHWYYGHRSQDNWFWTAKRLVDPTSNLSVRQAFILLTGGFTTGPGSEHLPALQSFGGFRPFQLRAIYANLDTEMEALAGRQAERPSVEMKHNQQDLIIEGGSRPRLKEHARYRLSLLEQGDHLIPVLKFDQDIEGVPVTQLILPHIALPVLEQLDGQRTLDEIVSEFAVSQNQTSTPEGVCHTYETMLAMLREMMKVGLIDLVETSA